MNFSNNKIFNLKVSELNHLLVGSGQIPLNIEVKQDDYTVCCSHTVVLVVGGGWWVVCGGIVSGEEIS